MAKSKPEERTKWVKWKRDHATRTRGILQSIKENTPCTDCGNKYPHYVMDFDHVGKKLCKVSAITSASRLKILTELAKCEVVCANCHRTRTYKRNPSMSVARKFMDWKRDHIVSIVPKNGKFLVVCSGCSTEYWEKANLIRWEVRSQVLFCSLLCGIRHGDHLWWYNHRKAIRRFLGKDEFKIMVEARLSRSDDSKEFRKSYTHPSKTNSSVGASSREKSKGLPFGKRVIHQNGLPR